MNSAGDLPMRVITVSETISKSVAFPEDLSLARRAVMRDEAAWREIYDTTRDRLFALLSYYTGQREDALELLQETYLSAINSIDRYRGDGSLAGWFAIIAIRRARDWRRKLAVWKRRRQELADERALDPPAMPNDPLRLQLQGAIAKLAGRQRASFLMREMEGLSFREIGEALGIGEPTARVHYHRAKKIMQNLLNPDDDATADPADGSAGGIATESRREPSLKGVTTRANPTCDTDNEEVST
ncbi:MAG: RNA polymerase sigma factor [Candidatus Eisenbacteria bacterium]|nr:RNA polymerase sigma factor [Candidatus Eisenbacteria bacterium]